MKVTNIISDENGNEIENLNNEEIMTIFFSELVSKKTHISVERIVMNEKKY